MPPLQTRAMERPTSASTASNRSGKAQARLPTIDFRWFPRTRRRSTLSSLAAATAAAAKTCRSAPRRVRIAPVFTVEQRDALRKHMLQLAEEDERVVAGAAVGSLAVNGGDRFSDLDLTFGIADDVPATEVLDDWTRTLIGERDAVHLADLERGPTTYRVFLLPDALQFDLSMTPAAQFRPAGPRFRLLFGETAAGESEGSTPPVAGDPFIPPPPVAGGLFGWWRIYPLHAP